MSDKDKAGDMAKGMLPVCPEHGATLCYGNDNGRRIYRCELGFVSLKYHKGKSGDEGQTVDYIAVTHREFWKVGNTIQEVKPHTSPWDEQGGLPNQETCKHTNPTGTAASNSNKDKGE